MNKTIPIILAASLITAVLVLASVAFGFKFFNDPIATPVIATKAPANYETKKAVSDNSGASINSSSGIEIPGYEVITMRAGEFSQKVRFFNPEGNQCYFQITIQLPDRTELFRSGMIPPGRTIEEIKLEETLEAGTYEGAFLLYSCYSLTDLQELNGATTQFTLEVVK